MKATELMIGDWYAWEAEGKLYYYQVTKETFSSPDYDIYNFQPIPITAEILEKNGLRWEIGGGGLIQMKIDGINCSINFNIIHYVHELQHALRLCGIEKTIEL